VVPIYHIDGLVRDLRFTPEILAGIYLGKITHWNDPLIRGVNKGLALPNREIRVVHRSDGSGTTYIWTDYLSKVSPEWRSAAGSATQIRWPVGAGANGNEGVAEAVRNTSDSIGYVEFIYALQSHLGYGAVRNAAGRFVQASLESLEAAASGAGTDQAGLRASITNAAAARAYPIASFTYFLVPEKIQDARKAGLLSAFLQWALTVGQRQSAALGYAALPDGIAMRALEALKENR